MCYDLFKDFGEKWRAGLISFKPYPCCRHTHSAIDAALDIRRQAAGRGLKTIRLLTYTTANTVAGTRSPATGRQAKFSLAYCVASTLLRGVPTETSFSDQSVNEADVKALEHRIEVVEDTEINACVPRNWPCRIEAVTDDGQELHAQIWNPTGDPENTLSWDGVALKFQAMTDGIIPANVQDEIIELCKHFDDLDKPSLIFEKINTSFTRKY